MTLDAIRGVDVMHYIVREAAADSEDPPPGDIHLDFGVEVEQAAAVIMEVCRRRADREGAPPQHLPDEEAEKIVAALPDEVVETIREAGWVESADPSD
ncbi:hypothetical protein [Haloplanus natans]|uniref:hypothetical protein n=1 Tax=Haloplanus natans TaxID=376171 RepID=UPI0006781637|nr:hypothetical protein [Haloplanus natans]